jgi:hypothetical protein
VRSTWRPADDGLVLAAERQDPGYGRDRGGAGA